MGVTAGSRCLSCIARAGGVVHNTVSLVMRCQLPQEQRLLVFDDISEICFGPAVQAWGWIACVAHEIKIH